MLESSFMHRVARRVALGVGVLLGLLVAPAKAQGTGDVDRMVENLRSGADFRVRTQAALALGASKTERAVQPLCRALADPNNTVRAASAAALGKLQLGGAQCLEDRGRTEPSATVKAAIQKALELVRGGGEPVFRADSKYYVSIGKTADKSGRSGDAVDRLVRSAMVGACGPLGIVIAPASETPADAKRRLAAHKDVKAFYFAPRVTPFDYADGNLKVRLEIAFFTYPDKNLIGNFAVPLTQQGVSPGDTTSENELLQMAAERAMEKLAPIAARMQ
ncbi:MAG TPA: HEAT repeat domain-containing protein [Polyangiaceae bacterium]|nr:HEAT repeat domain-containing protein [Polyangiaceae bacterium]